MKVKYYKKDDILTVRLSGEPVDYAEESNWIIINFSKNNKPVSIEILDASRFMIEQSKALLEKIKQSIFASA